MKRCNRCKLDLPLTAFHANAGRPDGKQNYCATCRVAYTAERHAADPTRQARYQAATAARPQHKALTHARYLRHKYGLTPTQYDEMVMAQCGACAVCNDQPGRRLLIHHDHATGKVLALLCYACNTGLGLLHDDPTVMRRAAMVHEGG